MKTLAVAAVLLMLSAPVLAAPPGPMMGGEGRMGMGMMQGMCPMGMGQRTEGALAFIRTELKITQAQTSAWDAFAAAYRAHKAQRGSMPMMRDGGMMMGPGAGPAKPLPERMSQHLAIMEEHLAQMKKLQPAVAQLYGGLGADQKKTADELMPMFLMCRMM
jgi:hypothetical protein